jgi:hypothetical protein
MESQNLVSLLFRPLRLVLPAETLRSVRIVLLKATHWPFVGLILAWENGRLYFTRSHIDSAMTLRGPKSPMSSRRSLAGILRTPSSKARPAQLDRSPRAGRKPMARPGQAVTETNFDLEAAVAALRTQVETIASLVEKRSDA